MPFALVSVQQAYFNFPMANLQFGPIIDQPSLMGYLFTDGLGGI